MHQRRARQALQILEPLKEELPQPEIRFAELTVSLGEDSTALEAQWRRLERFTRTSPHQSLDWCRAWCQAHQRQMLTVNAVAGGLVRLIVPLEIVPEHGIKVARLPGGRFNNINTCLLDPVLSAPDAEELQNFTVSLTNALRGKADLVVLDNVPLTWRGVHHPLAGLASIENQNHSFQLPLFANFEATLAQLNARSFGCRPGGLKRSAASSMSLPETMTSTGCWICFSVRRGSAWPSSACPTSLSPQRSASSFTSCWTFLWRAQTGPYRSTPFVFAVPMMAMSLPSRGYAARAIMSSACSAPSMKALPQRRRMHCRPFMMHFMTEISLPTLKLRCAELLRTATVKN